MQRQCKKKMSRRRPAGWKCAKLAKKRNIFFIIIIIVYFIFDGGDS